jgi:hypothetical protein
VSEPFLAESAPIRLHQMQNVRKPLLLNMLHMILFAPRIPGKTSQIKKTDISLDNQPPQIPVFRMKDV